ncbi:RecX family transcriptional regulator [Microbacterium sp. zg.Y1090]|uniref:regulatory protein RecX n=1 Tax=Microbacterium TaxID=33882 RepID=UPI00214C9B28|nr:MULTISPECIES: regulatory protein RecX [unclassified Microbacterium]MCR2813382.1 RecX family transcriptional regulator [Microbacterium sp. zg.Y1084]MCR2818282.1 RecX family transcriptional regulator [Microbacterium sp. zg.Y1090]MDL5486803.1 regulatory protein RecX [Microbacterium sp. zg-Y1211]WIM27574.1 regulatory protein RecX [Microbacterium sp. zg-Y1090]
MVRFESDGGVPEDAEGVAPVIPLFGAHRPSRHPAGSAMPTAIGARAGREPRAAAASTDAGLSVVGDPAGAAADHEVSAPIDLVPRWRSTWHDGGPGGARERRFAAERPDDARDDAQPDPAERVAAAERMLLKKLRTRQLSVSEARTALVSQELPADEIEQLLDDCLRRGYLDDERLAEQLIHTGTERKGQGRRAIAQTLSARGIPREVVDAALSEQPDDDAERALEFARTKARQLAHVDDDTALRRLMGQLARRGYPGSVAATAARAAIAENRSGGGGGVRFR